MKGDITIDKMSGLVYRDGKVLGRKNWEVECEIDLRLVKNTIVKAASQEEAEEACEDAFNIKASDYKKVIFVEDKIINFIG